MATKIKTSLLSNIDIDFDTNRPTSHVSNVYPTFGNEKGKQVEEVSLDGLGVPLLKSSNEKAVDSLKEANIDGITVDMIESYQGDVIKLKNGTTITFTTPVYERFSNFQQTGKIKDAHGNEFTFDKTGIHAEGNVSAEVYQISSEMNDNSYIEKLLNDTFKNATVQQREQFIQKIKDNFSLYEGTLKQLLENYKGKEEQFERDFGFPMYIFGEDGSIHFNYETLAVYLSKKLWSDQYGYTDLEEVNRAHIQLRPEAGGQLFRIMADGTIGINNTNYPITSVSEWDEQIPNFSDLGGYGEGNNLLIGQCTWFASRRYYQTHGVVPVNRGNATTWLESADPSLISSTPKKHSVIVLGGTEFGHVAFVEDVKYDASGNVSSITISEANVNGDPYNVESTVARAEQLTRVNTYSSLEEYANLVHMPVKGFIY